MDRQFTLAHLIAGSGIAVLTIVLLFGAANLWAEAAFSDGEETTLPCLNLSDPIGAVTAKPQTVCHQKLPESPVVEYRFNACGHRTDEKCHLDGPNDGQRVVLLGSSLVEGYGVPLEASFAGRLRGEIGRTTQRQIDFYNEAMQWGTPRSVALRMGDVLNEKPALVIWPLTPFDIENAGVSLPYIPGKQQGNGGAAAKGAAADVAVAAPTTLKDRVIASFEKHGGLGLFTAVLDRGVQTLRQTKAVFAAQHVMYGDQHEFIKHFLGNRAEASYLLADVGNGEAQAQLKTFERYYGEVSASLKAAGIPLYVMLLPSHPQVSLLSGAAGDFAEADPRALDGRLKDVIQRHGDHYIDVLEQFTGVSDPAAYFYAVDEHANERGHQLFARIIAQRLVATPSFMTAVAPAGAGNHEARP